MEKKKKTFSDNKVELHGVGLNLCYKEFHEEIHLDWLCVCEVMELYLLFRSPGLSLTEMYVPFCQGIRVDVVSGTDRPVSVKFVRQSPHPSHPS